MARGGAEGWRGSGMTTPQGAPSEECDPGSADPPAVKADAPRRPSVRHATRRRFTRPHALTPDLSMRGPRAALRPRGLLPPFTTALFGECPRRPRRRRLSGIRLNRNRTGIDPLRVWRGGLDWPSAIKACCAAGGAVRGARRLHKRRRVRDWPTLPRFGRAMSARKRPCRRPCRPCRPHMEAPGQRRLHFADCPVESFMGPRRRTWTT